MKGTNLGEFEELVLLIVANLYDHAYGLSIQTEIQKRANRKVSISTVHATLHRLKNKGFLDSKYDNSSITERGGRPKLLFKVTRSGEEALIQVRDMRNGLWDTISDLAFT